MIREEMDDEDIKIMSIGVDGENLERFGSIRSGVTDCASCIGMGSLMGSKNLKAIAVRGTLPIEIADPEGFLKHQQEIIELIQSSEHAHIMDRSGARAIHDETRSTGLVHLRNLRANQPPVSDEDKSKSWRDFCQECLYALLDTLGICRFEAVSLSPKRPMWEGFSRLIELVTGLNYTPEQLMEAGERIYNIERLFNIREGATRADDTLPERFFRWIITRTTERDRVIDREKSGRLLDEYYESHGWDKEGRPTPETLNDLGLDEEPSGLL
jgi:aldehyde:ferredoxin oxidoreductase